MVLLAMFVLLTIAVENLADIFVTVGFLEPYREWFENAVPSLAKVARCHYCQTFWLSGLACVLLMPICAPMVPVFWLAMHKCCQVVSAFSNWYLPPAN